MPKAIAAITDNIKAVTKTTNTKPIFLSIIISLLQTVSFIFIQALQRPCKLFRNLLCCIITVAYLTLTKNDFTNYEIHFSLQCNVFHCLNETNFL